MKALQEIREVDGIKVAVEIDSFVYEKHETPENTKEALNNTFLFLEDESGENTLDIIKENKHWVNCDMHIDVNGEEMLYYAVAKEVK